MKSSFPKRVKRHSKIWACNVNTKCNYYVLEKSFSDMNKCLFMYIFIRDLFQNMIPKIVIVIATSILGLALNAFWKRALHIYVAEFTI